MAHSRACFKKNELALGRRWLWISILLGAFFLVFQGYEWIQLLKFGFTLSSSVYGGLFYLLIGAHGFHVMGALAILIYVWYRIKTPGNPITPEGLFPFQLLWYFVVCVWQVLYILVYLSWIKKNTVLWFHVYELFSPHAQVHTDLKHVSFTWNCILLCRVFLRQRRIIAGLLSNHGFPHFTTCVNACIHWILDLSKTQR